MASDVTQRESADSRQTAIEALRDWSRWLVTLGTVASAGCAVMLRGSDNDKMQFALGAAVVSFVASVFFAVLLGRGLAFLLASPAAKPDIYQEKAFGEVTVQGLAGLQLAALFIACLFLTRWVCLRSTAEPPPEKAQTILLTTDPNKVPVMGRIVVSMEDHEASPVGTQDHGGAPPTRRTREITPPSSRGEQP